MAGALSDRLALARVQDAAGWATLAVVLLLAPWAGLYHRAGLPAPASPRAWQAGGVLLAAAAVALALSRSRRAIAAAAGADLVAAAAIAVWLARGAGLGTWGTPVTALVAVALAIQAALDVAMLLSERRAGR